MNTRIVTVRTTNLYLLTLFFGLCIFSSFLLQKIYVPLYLAFVAFSALYFGKIEFLRINGKAVLFLVLFLAWSTFVYVTHMEFSQARQLVKIVVVISFFFGAVTFINNLYSNHYLPRYFMILYHVIGVILILNFLHVVRNVHLEGLWTFPFSGDVTSTGAYRIENPGIFFGANNKNIWATKILLVWIIFHQYQKRISGKGLFPLAVHGAVVFSIVYTFSRTAQVVFFVYMILNFLSYIQHRKQLVKYFLILVILPVFAYGLYKVIPKLIHFNFDESDGFYSRIILWMSVLEIDVKDLLLGSGIQYGEYFIPRHTPIDNDNFHNVFLNQLVDVGVVGVLCYILFLLFYFSGHRTLFSFTSIILFAPLFLVINSHYLGYDNDVFNYIILSYPLLYFGAQKSAQNDPGSSGSKYAVADAND